MEVLKGMNLALRFLLELCALGALGYWGFKVPTGAIAKFGLGIGVPLLAAAMWGVLLSPRAPVSLPGIVVLALQMLVFCAAAIALVAAGHRTLGLLFGATVVVNALLMVAWDR